MSKPCVALRCGTVRCVALRRPPGPGTRYQVPGTLTPALSACLEHVSLRARARARARWAARNWADERRECVLSGSESVCKEMLEGESDVFRLAVYEIRCSPQPRKDFDSCRDILPCGWARLGPIGTLPNEVLWYGCCCNSRLPG